MQLLIDIAGLLVLLYGAYIATEALMTYKRQAEIAMITALESLLRDTQKIAFEKSYLEALFAIPSDCENPIKRAYQLMDI